ncbi:hypothetical protein FOZ63_003805, partial [Perkinsus olseni]
RFVDDAKREGRRKEREVTSDKRKFEDEKTLQKSMRYKEMEEVRRLQAWKTDELERRERNAAVRFEKERRRDEAARKVAAKQVRGQKEGEREATRNRELRKRLRSLPSGLAVPSLVA